MLAELPQGRDDGKPAAMRWAAEVVDAAQSARCSCPRWPLVVGEWLGRDCRGCVVWFGCEGVVRGRRSREQDRSLRRSWWRSGGVSVGGGMAVVCDGVVSKRKLVWCGGMEIVGSMR